MTHVKQEVLPAAAGASEDGPPGETPEPRPSSNLRARLHFIKYLKRGGKTVKLWECGICRKDFRQKYALLKHLPVHTGNLSN